jgi:hypothetical protein
MDAFYGYLPEALRAVRLMHLSEEPPEIVADIFTQLLNREIEDRGARRWPFDMMDAAVSSGRSTARLLFTMMNRDEEPSAADRSALEQNWRELVGHVARLQHVPPDSLPYRGCTPCGAPCYYRYDISRRFRPKPEETLQFVERLADASAGSALLSQIQGIGRQAFPAAQHSTQAGAAYCYLVHQLDAGRARISPVRAQHIAKAFWQELHRPTPTDGEAT